ncbi:MAG: proton-conducting transporter membrane subunit, partial [Micromonosporaceae bacterium]
MNLALDTAAPVLEAAPASGLLSSIWLLVAIPLLSAGVLLLLGRRADRWGHWLGCASVGVAFLLGLSYLFALRAGSGAKAVVATLFPFISVERLQVDVSLRFDPLASIFVLLITGVGFLIHVYAVGYMAEDPGRRRFFGYFNLFVAAMLLLVLGGNYVMTFIGWEGVGLASYLLISFWYHKPSAATAGKKAFLMNRVGDAGFLVAIFLMFAYVGSTDFDTVFSAAGALPAGALLAMALT